LTKNEIYYRSTVYLFIYFLLPKKKTVFCRYTVARDNISKLKSDKPNEVGPHKNTRELQSAPLAENGRL